MEANEDEMAEEARQVEKEEKKAEEDKRAAAIFERRLRGYFGDDVS